MPRNAFLDETKDVQVPVGAPGWVDKVRVQPTIVAILDAARAVTLGKGDQLIHGALKIVLIEAIIAGRFHDVYATVGMILGLPHPNAVADTPSGKSLPERESKPPAKANGR